MRTWTQQLHSIRPDGDDRVRKQVINDVVGELVILEVLVVFVPSGGPQLALLCKDVSANTVERVAPCVLRGIQAPLGHQTDERLGWCVAGVTAARLERRKPAAIVSVGERVELTLPAVTLDIGHELGMQHVYVVGLVEIVSNDLPI